MSFVYSAKSHSKVFHLPHCRLINRIPAELLRESANLESLLADGYRLCNCCSKMGTKLRQCRKEVDSFCKENSMQFSLMNNVLTVIAPTGCWKITSNSNNKLHLYRQVSDCALGTYQIAVNKHWLSALNQTQLTGYLEQTDIHSHSILGYLVYIRNNVFSSRNESLSNTDPNQKIQMSFGFVDIRQKEKIIHPITCSCIKDIPDMYRLHFSQIKSAFPMGYRRCNCSPGLEFYYQQYLDRIDKICRIKNLKAEYTDGEIHVVSQYKYWKMIHNKTTGKLQLFEKYKFAGADDLSVIRLGDMSGYHFVKSRALQSILLFLNYISNDKKNTRVIRDKKAKTNIVHLPYCSNVATIPPGNQESIHIESSLANGYHLCNCMSVSCQFFKYQKEIQSLCSEKQLDLELDMEEETLYIESRHDDWAVKYKSSIEELSLYHYENDTLVPYNNEKQPSDLLQLLSDIALYDMNEGTILSAENSSSVPNKAL